MQYSQVKAGRIFLLRLEHGETIHVSLQEFARQQEIKAAVLTVLGGAQAGSTLVVGPENGQARPVQALQHILEDVHEVQGSGTIFPDDQGNPAVHLHLACGRAQNTVTGCIRPGVVVWQILEIVLQELMDCKALRRMNPDLGLGILDIPNTNKNNLLLRNF